MPKINPQLFNEILEQVSSGSSLTKALKNAKINIREFFEYVDSDSDKMNQYVRAREHRGEACVEHIEEYQQELRERKIDSATARVLIDTEKWKASKFYPKMYGEKVENVLSGTVNMLPAITIRDKDNKEKNVDFAVGDNLNGNTSA